MWKNVIYIELWKSMNELMNKIKLKIHKNILFTKKSIKTSKML